MVTKRAGSERENAIRILVASDRNLVCSGVRAIFSNSPLWDICGEAKNGPESVSKAGELKPDLVFLDLRPSEGDQPEFLGKINQLAPAAKIVALTSSECRQLELAAQGDRVHEVIAKRMLSNTLLNTLQQQINLTSYYLHALVQASFAPNEDAVE